MKTITPSELKYQVENAGHDSHFFTRKTMQFFGDTMRNYGTRAATIQTNYNAQGDYVEAGCTVEVWELYRRKPVSHGLTSSAYFDRVTYKRVFSKSEA